jgi:protease I
MERKLNHCKVAILVTDGFEESELTRPSDALKKAGATVHIISIRAGKIKSWKDKNWANDFDVDKTIDEVAETDYDALVLPGGLYNPDKLRQNMQAVRFASSFLSEGKPVAAICHGPWTLIETGMIRGRTMTSYPSLKSDLMNAGVHWIDREVVVDNGLVTSRNPDDLDAFCEKMLEEITEGVHL